MSISVKKGQSEAEVDRPDPVITTERGETTVSVTASGIKANQKVMIRDGDRSVELYPLSERKGLRVHCERYLV